jgi:hypothetical protein
MCATERFDFGCSRIGIIWLACCIYNIRAKYAAPPAFECALASSSSPLSNVFRLLSGPGVCQKVGFLLPLLHYTIVAVSYARRRRCPTNQTMYIYYDICILYQFDKLSMTIHLIHLTIHSMSLSLSFSLSLFLSLSFSLSLSLSLSFLLSLFLCLSLSLSLYCLVVIEFI